MSLLLEMFTYPFIVRAFVVGILVSLCAALLGVPLVLKRYSMIGDGLSHVSFGALSIAVACGWAPLPPLRRCPPRPWPPASSSPVSPPA